MPFGQGYGAGGLLNLAQSNRRYQAPFQQPAGISLPQPQAQPQQQAQPMATTAPGTTVQQPVPTAALMGRRGTPTTATPTGQGMGQEQLAQIKNLLSQRYGLAV